MIVLSLAVVAVFSVPTVFADGNGSMLLDFTHEGEAVAGAPFDLYKVADLDKDGKVTTIAEPFASYADQIKVLEPIEDPKSKGAGKWTELAAQLADYVTIQKITPIDSGETKANGRMAFGSMTDGRYLVVGRSVEKTITNSDGTTTTKVYTGSPFLADIQGEPRTAKIKPDVDTKTNVSIKAKKVWTGGTPQSIQIQLIRVDNKQPVEGEPIKTIDANTNWESTSWTNLPGKCEDYTVQEVPVPTGFTSTVGETTAQGEITITNTPYTPPSPSGNKGTVSVEKKWDGDDGLEAERPTSVVVQLMRNGEPYGKPVTLPNNGKWNYTWRNLPRDTSKDFDKEYTVTEESSNTLYSPGVSGGVNGNTLELTLTNSYNPPDNPDIPDDPTPLGPPGVDYTVQKVWEDKGYETKRPTSVDVILTKDGKEYDTQTLNEANGWKYTWTDLDGEATWSVKEKSIPAGYEVKTSLENYTVTMTNTYNPENKTTPPSGTTKKTGKLPQTGMLWWPVPVLGCAGLLLILLGLVRKNKRRRTDGE